MVEKASLSNVYAVLPQTLRPATAVAPVSSTAPTSAASATLSARARELSQSLEVVRQAPDIRPERVAALKERIQAGTYRVPETLLAQKMLDLRV